MSERWKGVTELARALAGATDRDGAAALLSTALEKTFRPTAFALAFEEGDAEAAVPSHARPLPAEVYRPFLTLALRRGALRLDGTEAIAPARAHQCARPSSAA